MSVTVSDSGQAYSLNYMLCQTQLSPSITLLLYQFTSSEPPPLPHGKFLLWCFISFPAGQCQLGPAQIIIIRGSYNVTPQGERFEFWSLASQKEVCLHPPQHPWTLEDAALSYYIKVLVIIFLSGCLHHLKFPKWKSSWQLQFFLL